MFPLLYLIPSYFPRLVLDIRMDICIAWACMASVSFPPFWVFDVTFTLLQIVVRAYGYLFFF